jgi:hypothetical protein
VELAQTLWVLVAQVVVEVFMEWFSLVVVEEVIA